jgi:hypothetical protein
VLGESACQGDGVLVGDAQAPTGLVRLHRDLGEGPALPDDAQATTPVRVEPGVGDASLAVHGEADLGDDGADELFAFAHCDGGCIERRPDLLPASRTFPRR